MKNLLQKFQRLALAGYSHKKGTVSDFIQQMCKTFARQKCAPVHMILLFTELPENTHYRSMQHFVDCHPSRP